MSKSITTTLLVLSVVLVAACSTRTTRTDQVSTQQEFVIVEPEPISVEPVYTGKFK